MDKGAYIFLAENNEQDFIGTGKFIDILNIIKKKYMINLLNSDYKTVIKNNGFNNLKKDKFDKFLNFSKAQLN